MSVESKKTDLKRYREKTRGHQHELYAVTARFLFFKIELLLMKF